jgi:hypothetical protein
LVSAKRFSTSPACQPRGPAIADFVIVRSGAHRAGHGQAAEMQSEPHQVRGAVRRRRRRRSLRVGVVKVETVRRIRMTSATVTTSTAMSPIKLSRRPPSPSCQDART